MTDTLTLPMPKRTDWTYLMLAEPVEDIAHHCVCVGNERPVVAPADWDRLALEVALWHQDQDQERLISRVCNMRFVTAWDPPSTDDELPHPHLVLDAPTQIALRALLIEAIRRSFGT